MQCSTDSDVFARRIAMLIGTSVPISMLGVRRGQEVDVSTPTPTKERIYTYAKKAQTTAVA